MNEIINKYKYLLLVGLAFLIVFVFSILAYRASFVFVDNADSHWIGVLTHYAQPNDIFNIPSHTSAIKIPIVYIFNKILGFNLLSYSAINLFIMLVMILPSLLIVLKYSKNEDLNVRIFKLLLFGLILTGSTYFFMSSAMSSLRNIEMGIVILIFYLQVKILISKDLTKRAYWILSAVIFIFTFIITLTDQLNLILLLSPLAMLFVTYKLNKFPFRKLAIVSASV